MNTENAQNAHIVRVVVQSFGDAETPGLFHYTRVMVGDVELDGVHSIRLECHRGDVWTADIRCEVGPIDIAALLQPAQEPPPIIVAGIDTCEDRIEVQIEGWGADGKPGAPA